MDFLERDLEEILSSTPKHLIQERGLHPFQHQRLYRQFRIEGYGIIDLLGITYRNGNFFVDVYELKNKKINIHGFLQLCRYIKAIKIVFRDLKEQVGLQRKDLYVSGYLIGREVDMESDFCFIPTINSDIAFYTYSYDFNGIIFKQEMDSYFNKGYNGFDEFQLGYSSVRNFLTSVKNKGNG